MLYRQKPGHMPRRTSEFIATRRPILAFPSCQGTWSEDVLKKSGAAVIASSKEEIKNVIVGWVREFEATRRISMPVNEELVQYFSSHHMAEEVDESLTRLVGA